MFKKTTLVYFLQTSQLLKAINILVLTAIFLLHCKTVPDDATLDEYLMNLMNNRKYEEVISTIDGLPKVDQTKSKYILLRGEALFGLAGYDLISLTSVVKKALDFNSIEKSLSGLLKIKSDINNTPVPNQVSKSQIALIRSFISLASYLSFVNEVVAVGDSSRPRLIESLATLTRVNIDDEDSYRKARTQSLMIHTIFFISSVKKSISPLTSNVEGLDAVCTIDANIISNETPWLVEHLAGALDDMLAIKKDQQDSKGAVARIQSLKKIVYGFKNSNSQESNPAVMLNSIKTIQNQICVNQ
jgi:hypothetical protein